MVEADDSQRPAAEPALARSIFWTLRRLRRNVWLTGASTTLARAPRHCRFPTADSGSRQRGVGNDSHRRALDSCSLTLKARVARDPVAASSGSLVCDSEQPRPSHG